MVRIEYQTLRLLSSEASQRVFQQNSRSVASQQLRGCANPVCRVVVREEDSEKTFSVID